MKITGIKTYPVRIMIHPEVVIRSALGIHDVSRYTLVRVETDAGLVGAGEATVMPRWSGETMEGPRSLIDDILGPLYHTVSVAHNPVRIAGGTAHCPDGPGLGVEVDWELVESLKAQRGQRQPCPR